MLENSAKSGDFDYILKQIDNGVLTRVKAAAMLGVSRTTLRNMIAEYSNPSFSKFVDFPDGFDRMYSEYLAEDINIPDIAVALNKSRREVELMIRRYTALLKEPDKDEDVQPESLSEAES